MNWTLALLLLALHFPGGVAQQPDGQLPKGQMPNLGRPTNKNDPMPIINFEEYFVGTWSFEWDVPESPLGPAGQIRGTEVYRPGLEGRFYESEIEGADPQGPFKGRATIIYHPTNKFVARYETDTRGLALFRAGPIGGDLGGYYTIYYESAPFVHSGRVVRMKTTTLLLSPVHFKVRAQISVDGGPFVSYGNPWWRKQVPGVTNR